MFRDWYTYGPAYGTKALRLHGKIISPEFFQLANGSIRVFIIVCVFFGFGMWLESGWNGEVGIILLAAMLIWAFVELLHLPMLMARLCFGPRVDVVISPEWVKVGGLLFHKTYVTSQYGFFEEDHPEAIAEIENRRLNPEKFAKKPALYTATKQLVLYVEDKRIVIASLYNAPNMTKRMAMRLNMMKQAVNEMDMTG
ncbi:MAG: hypothetical protein R3E57_07325 [Porticoccaceae bacterium]